MAEKVWKRMSFSVPNLSSLVDDKATNKWLNFSKWFKYQNTNLGQTHNSAEEVKSLNRERMETHLWTKISTEDPDKKEIENYLVWLSKSDYDIVQHLADEGYGYNEIRAYMDKKSEFVNPMAQWTWIFERVGNKTVTSNSNTDWKEVVWRNPIWALNTAAAWIVWWLWLQIWWQLLQWQWKRRYENAVKPTKNDVDLMATEAANKKKYDYFNERANKIKKEMDWLVEWDQKWNELNEQYNKEIASRDRYAPTDRRTTVEIQREAGTAWDYFDAAVDTDFEATKRWTEKVKPYMEASPSKFRKVDFIERLTPELFKNVDEYKWEKQYKPVIEEMKEIYSKWWEISLSELEEWKKTFKPSKDFLAWDTAQAIERDIHDKLYSMLRTEIKSTLEAENPWKNVWRDYSEYGKWLEASEESLKKAKSEMTKTEKPSKTYKQAIKKKIDKLFGRWFKTKLAVLEEKVWKAITPSSRIKALQKWFDNNWAKVEEAVVDAAKSGKIKNVRLVNPYDIFLQTMMEEKWLEPLIYPLSEFAAYQYERSKMSKEEKENATNLMENQDWYKKLVESEKGNTRPNDMTWEEILETLEKLD